MVQKQIIRKIVQAHQKNLVQAGQFFISWNGVPTLAYTGFSPVLLTIKKEIKSSLPSINKENPGSRWPKTTLGALNDEVTLSIDDLSVLRNICDLYNPELQDLSLEIDKLSVVLFYCRSLEKRLLTETIPLKDPINTSTPPRNHLEEVSNVMIQFSRAGLHEYLPYVQKEGHRQSHYHTPYISATLVFDLEEVPKIIAIFKNEVDKRLPERFCWFSDESLHMTVRALI